MERKRAGRGSGRTGIVGHLNQAVRDVVSQTGGTAVIAISGLIFVAAAIGGQTMVGSLGDFGWIAYAAVMGVIAMSLGPVFVVGVKVRLRGSARHRAQLEERVQQQRIKFGLVKAQDGPRRLAYAPEPPAPSSPSASPDGAGPSVTGQDPEPSDTRKASV